MAQRHTLCPSKASQVNTTQMIKSWGHSSAGLGPQCRRYCSTHIATKDKNQTKTNTLLRPFFFQDKLQQGVPLPCSGSGREATSGLGSGLGSFAEVAHKGHGELTFPPSAVEVSFSIYSQNMNHITSSFLLFTDYQRAVSCLQGHRGRGKMERGRKSVPLSQLG